jgi:hypothetical protein
MFVVKYPKREFRNYFWLQKHWRTSSSSRRKEVPTGRGPHSENLLRERLRDAVHLSTVQKPERWEGDGRC